MPARSSIDIRRIKIRRARPSDKRTVLTFCHRTWGDWGDYIDKVWDEWAGDKKGYFAIASLAGRPIGTGKLTVLNKREVWFEGLRVDPASRGMGISHLLTGFLAREALKGGAETVRYATGARNRASLHIGKSWGMRPVGRYSILSARADGRRSNVFARISDPVRTLEGAGLLELSGERRAGFRNKKARYGEALDEILDLVRSAPFTRAMAGLASKGWTFFQVDRDFLVASLKKRELFLGAWPRNATPLGVLIASPQRDKGRLLIKLVAEFKRDALGDLLSGARGLAHELNLPQIRLVVPATRSLLASARAVGYKEEDRGFYHVVMETNLKTNRTRERMARLVNRYF